jgi:hypothetical protein
MIGDITRLIIKMMTMKAIEAGVAGGATSGMIGGAGATFGLGMIAKGLTGGFKHGGSFRVGSPMPRYEHGGQFHVGGSGAPDSRLVQFMASPGERVSITNPGQSRMDANSSKQQAPAPAPVINNMVDPSQFGAALATPAGSKAIANTIQMHPALFKRVLK